MRAVSFAAAVILSAGVSLPAMAQAYLSPRHTGSVAGQPGAGSPAPGSYGGGFIELLMTGRDPTPHVGRQPVQGQSAPRAAAHPAPVSPHVGAWPQNDPMTGEPVAGSRRQVAALGAASPQFERPIERVLDPRFERQEVAYEGRHAAGTIVIDTTQKFLFLVQPGGRALRYGIGVGRPGFGWTGNKSITRKAEWPDWTPPAAMLKRRPDLPRFMPGGGDNPMGARALYLGSSLYRIHGTNEPHTIGQAVSSGCFRMTNDDVTDLYNRVRVGARVVVM
jgi:lipoprotein-anchoring transpeptidase ErfK/SrfK